MKKVKMGRPVVIPGEKPTREKILNAAVDLFAEKGYDRTSVRQIARAVDLTESAVYRHYPGKEAILDAVFELAKERVFTPLPFEAALDQLGGESVFRALLAPLPLILISEPFLMKIMRIMYSEMLHNEKIRRYFHTEFLERGDDYIQALFDRCVGLGLIKPCDTRALARIFNSFRSDWAFRQFIINPEIPDDPEKLLRDLEGPIRFFEQLV